MRNYFAILLCTLVLAGCSDPKNTPLPRQVDKMDTLGPALAKLTPEERELATAYMMRQTMAAKFAGVFGGKEGPGIPEGMTVGKAIEEQRKFALEMAAEEARQAALKAKLQAERDAALKPMKEAITVTLVSKRVRPERGMSGMLLDEHLEVTFGYKNNTDKDIAGSKGLISIKDLFGDQISAFMVSNDTTIKAGQTGTWTGWRSVKYPRGENKDGKLAELTEDKFKVVWEPRMIVFTDGSKLVLPAEQP